MWAALGVGAAAATATALVQRGDSAVPYAILLGAALILVRAWFSTARPEVRFTASEADAASGRGERSERSLSVLSVVLETSRVSAP